MISQQWRERLTYTAMSVIVAWHTLAMVIAPAPDDNLIVLSARRLFQPYLSLFRLDNRWDFFAPDVNRGLRLRYDIEDAAGKLHAITPDNELSWFHPNFFWFGSWYFAIMESPDIHGDAAAAYFCARHASLRPVAVTFLKIEEKAISPMDHGAGKRPSDPEFVTVNTLKRIKCPNS